jgi:hypothetical protein
LIFIVFPEEEENISSKRLVKMFYYLQGTERPRNHNKFYHSVVNLYKI